MGAGSILGTQLSVASHIMESIGGGRTGLLLVRLLKVNALPAYNNFWSPRSLFLPPSLFVYMESSKEMHVTYCF